MIDLHRHDEYSTYDGFGRASDLVPLVKSLGHTALSTTNHGNTNGLIQTYNACKEQDFKAILGVEGYFLPKKVEQHRGYHLVLIAKDLEGYGNLNRIQYEGEKIKYYNPIWTFELLERYRDGLICLSACIGSYSSQCAVKCEKDKMLRYFEKMQSIFCDDFYIEIQPYKLSEKWLQERANIWQMKGADKLGIECILTSDSHMGSKDDLESYLIMHEIAKHDLEHIEQTYGERYIPTEKELINRFVKMHTNDYKDCNNPAYKGWKTENIAFEYAIRMIHNIDKIDKKCEKNYLDALEMKLPHIDLKSSKYQNTADKLKSDIMVGLKRRGKTSKEYIDRCKIEYSVIKHHGFEDYFLIVADYVKWAKNNDIAVGPGRGSVCNCLVAYALGITEVDSLYFDLDFNRFLRKDKKKYPDIDLDFQTSRRQEVIEYICQKYKGHSARICSYGLYKIDNLINDLAPVCGLHDKKVIKEIKDFVSSCIKSDLIARQFSFVALIDKDKLFDDPQAKQWNKNYADIMYHFYKMFLKVKYIGTHAAGVAIVQDDLLKYTAIRRDKEGREYTNYNLDDLESINVMKFDILGLKTLESIADLRKATGEVVDYEEVTMDEAVIAPFSNGECDGIFQFERSVARSVLRETLCSNFNDIVAASSMNRPGPLMQKLPQQYAHNKQNVEDAKVMPYYKYTKESYGTVIYQEQIQAICMHIGELSWNDVDRIMKLIKTGRASQQAAVEGDENYKELLKKFQKGAIKHGMSNDDSFQLFYNLTGYTFNKGHSTGYSLLTVEEMYYKIYHPAEYWFVKIKYSQNDEEFDRFCNKAVHGGLVVFLPHVNLSQARTSIRLIEGEKCLQQGVSDLKGIGEKAAQFIIDERNKNGKFTSYDDFFDRCKSRSVTSRTIEILKTCGVLEFDKKTYLSRVTKYNSALMSKNLVKR